MQCLYIYIQIDSVFFIYYTFEGKTGVLKYYLTLKLWIDYTCAILCPNVQNKSWKWFEINLLPQSSCTAMVKRVLVKQFEKWRTPWEPSIKVVHLESCITFLLIAWGVSYSSFNNGRIPLETRADNKASHGLRFTGGNGGLIINNDLYINSFSLEGVDLMGVTDQFPMNQSFATLGSHQEQERRQSVPLLNKNGSLV